ncbi:uncharacterized protein At5g41620-like [Musa acuminata AAA Group]|uniref:uncharacterized protein At5g41620-like n=1 Tax=Musa acuminata AAA Group TaxID=214697 RepID=UPI0031D7192D
MEGGKGVAIDDEEGSAGVKEDALGLKLRRGVTVGKKGGLCTPVPTWKLGDAGSADADAGEPKRSSVSARKLGANLWEIQDLMPVSVMSRRGAKIRRHADGKALDDGPDRLAVRHEDLPQSAGSLRRQVAASLVKHYKLNERNSRALQPVSPASYSSSMEIAAISEAITPSSSVNLKGKLGEAGYSLQTSTELLKVLNRIWSLEEQHSCNVSLVKALKVELEHAQARIQELMQEQHVYQHEMDDLMKQVAEDKLIRKNKEQQKIKAAVQSIRDELEDERRLRRRSESLHRKLGKELSEVNAAYMKAVKDLERERKTNSPLEDLCDEFAKAVTDYEQEVRELKQKSQVACDHKVDRLVLHISEAWLDERVQMNIAEDQGDLAEKTTITDRLSSEIESFLRARRSRAFGNDRLYRKDEKKDTNMRRQSLESVHLNGTTSAPHDADDDDDDDDSVASEMHCFELNMATRGNGSRDQPKQNTQNGIEKLDSKRTSTLPGEKIGCSESKDDSSEYGEQMDKTKLRGSKVQLLDRVQGVHSPTDAESDKVAVDHIELSRTKKSDYRCSQEHGHDTKLTWARWRGSRHLTANSLRYLSEISECYPEDHGNHHRESSHNHLLWRTQLGSAGGGDTDSGDVHQITSPVRQWKYQISSPNQAVAPESSSKSAQGSKEGTLKAKLLEARLEGKHTRLKSLRRSSVARARQ